jgi:hypothetical protein
MHETEESNKNRNEIWKMMKQHPDMLDMLKIYYKKQQQNKQSEFKSWRKTDSFTMREVRIWNLD